MTSAAAADAAAPVPAEDAAPARPHQVVRKIAHGFLSYGMVMLAAWMLIKNLQNADGLDEAVKLISWPQIVVISLFGILNLATNWPPLVIGLPGLKLKEAGVTNSASVALSNTVPEGGAVATALNFTMLKSWGFRYPDITSEMLVTGTWSQFTKYILLAIGMLIAVLHGWGPPNTVWVALALVVAVVVAVVLFGLILRSEAFARRLGTGIDHLIGHVMGWFRKSNPSHLATTLPDFRTTMNTLLRFCWHKLTVAELVSQLTTVLVLGIACRMEGLGESTINWAVLVVAWGAVTLASLVVPTPGGVGVAEIVLVTVLGYGLPESTKAAVLGAVLLYRIATFLVPIPLGLGAYLYWSRSTAWHRPADSRGPGASQSIEEAAASVRD